MKYSDFQEPKPPRMPLMITPTPDRISDLSKLDTNFNDVLADNIDTNQETKADTKSSKSQKLAVAHSTLQTSIIQQGMKHIEHAKIAQIEQLGQKTNSERVGEKNYINYAAAFQAGISSSTADDIKRKKKQYEEIPIDEEKDDDNPAKGLSYTHNLSLYKNITEFNPYKKQDTVNYNLFKNSPMFDLANKSFMSPLRLLDESVFTNTKASIQNIEKSTPKITGLSDIYKDNDVTEIDINSNYHNIENVKNNDNYIWTEWEDSSTFHYLINRYNDIQKYSNLIRQFGGNFKDQHVHLNRIKTLEEDISKQNTALTTIVDEMNSLLKKMISEINTNSTLMSDPRELEKFKLSLDSMEEMISLIEPKLSLLPPSQTSEMYFYYNQIKTQTQNTNLKKHELDEYFKNKSTKQAQNWWETIGKNIEQEGMLIPFALMAESAHSIYKDSKLTLNEDENSFENKLINGYSSQLNSSIFKSKQPNNAIITPKDLMIENIDYGRSVYNKLVNLKIINKTGTISNFDPNKLTIDLKLDSDEENNRIRRILKKKIKGDTTFDYYDAKQINNNDREDILIIDPQGNKQDLNTIFNPLKGTSNKEKYSNALKKYNILFDMFQEMTNNKDSLGNKLTYNYEAKNNKIHVPVYPNSEWVQHNPKIPILNTKTEEIEFISGWEKIENAPLVMEFNTLEKADNFFNKILEAILQLEPMLATFNNNLSSEDSAKLRYSNDDIIHSPLRTIVDNEGYHSNAGIITSTSSNFNYHIDYAANKDFFKTAHWTQIANYTKSKVIFEIGKKIFSKSIVNRISKNNHKQKKEEYDQRKKDWDEREYTRKVEEKKKESKNRARTKSLINATENKAKKRKAEHLKEIKKQAAIKQKRENQRKMQIQKAQAKKKK
jgi:hypothetical protein